MNKKNAQTLLREVGIYISQSERDDIAAMLDQDPMFYADKCVGYVVTLMAGIGIGAAVVGVCVWLAVRGGV